jgi:hypothetical protein
LADPMPGQDRCMTMTYLGGRPALRHHGRRWRARRADRLRHEAHVLMAAIGTGQGR